VLSSCRHFSSIHLNPGAREEFTREIHGPEAFIYSRKPPSAKQMKSETCLCVRGPEAVVRKYRCADFEQL
ncbi:MAG: hypothetical protein WA714_02320, partial [Candidatus Acidiferrales bacterium]